ncbi:MAG: cysteine synthase A [Victivallales bacterium]|nr:cysteine synthase A [Victivallales bacterium]
MKIFNNISETVGNTPVVKLNRINSSKSNIFAKLEFFNPTSSVKDRIAVNMINEAEKAGLLQPGGAIIEPTSGNTGLGLAMTAASRGYRLIITMPETMSVERQRLMKQLGAEIILTDGSKGMNGAIKMAEKIAEERSAFMPQQFNNFSNPEIHYKTTGPEIWEVSEGEIDIFVAGIGTGGTISGAGKFLKEKKPDLKIYGIEPETSAVLSGEKPGKHGIQGIGAGFVPEVLNTELIDKVFKVSDKDALDTSKKLAALEGILCGISSGAAVFTALKIAEDENNKNIFVVIPDTGERYLSTDLFNEKS